MRMYGGDAPSPGGKTTAEIDVSTGRFLSLDPGKRIVQSVEFESADPSFAGEMILTWTFEPLATGTLVTVTADKVPSAISEEDHDAGLRSSLEANRATSSAAAAGVPRPVPARTERASVIGECSTCPTRAGRAAVARTPSPN